MNRNLPFLSILLFLFFSCSKDKTIDDSLLLKGKWFLDSTLLKVTEPNQPFYNIDTTIYPEECEKDNFIRFFINNSFSEYSGLKKCTTTEPDSLTGKWLFLKGNSSLILNSGNSGYNSYKIIELNSTRLILTEDTTIIINVPVKIIKSVNKEFFYENK